jgi:hypothetical protein
MFGTFNVGLVGLAVNLVVLGIAALIERAVAKPAAVQRESSEVATT